MPVDEIGRGVEDLSTMKIGMIFQVTKEISIPFVVDGIYYHHAIPVTILPYYRRVHLIYVVTHKDKNIGLAICHTLTTFVGSSSIVVHWDIISR